MTSTGSVTSSTSSRRSSMWTDAPSARDSSRPFSNRCGAVSEPRRVGYRSGHFGATLSCAVATTSVYSNPATQVVQAMVDAVGDHLARGGSDATVDLPLTSASTRMRMWLSKTAHFAVADGWTGGMVGTVQCRGREDNCEVLVLMFHQRGAPEAFVCLWYIEMNEGASNRGCLGILNEYLPPGTPFQHHRHGQHALLRFTDHLNCLVPRFRERFPRPGAGDTLQRSLPGGGPRRFVSGPPPIESRQNVLVDLVTVFDARTDEESNACPACRTYETSATLLPCTHGMCNGCAARTTHCPYCNTKVENRRLFDPRNR